MIAQAQRPRIVIVGAGFGGVACARALRGADADVFLVDRSNHHTFQPLLYQVATAGLSPANIATPVRALFKKDKNISVVMGEVDAIDPDNKQLVARDRKFPYDYLVLATGVKTSYYGNDHWSQTAPGLKTIDDAIEIRRRFLLAFESAELEVDEDARRAALTFVIVGGGPTGVELAGTMAELANKSIADDFRRIDTKTTRVLLIDGGDRVLSTYSEKLSHKAEQDLRDLGVELMLNTMVENVEPGRVTLNQSGDRSVIEAANVFWAAGVRAESIVDTLGCETDKMGRAVVRPDLSITGRSEVFVIGDAATVTDPKSGQQVPGVAQGAMQMGAHVGRIIKREINSSEPTVDRPPFTYWNKGEMATIGRGKAVADVGGVEFSGPLAWLLWAVVHIAFLVDFRSRLFALLEWAWMYVFLSRSVRLITGRGTRVQVKEPGGSPAVSTTAN